ncbi:putative ribosome-binding factor A, mitochondrial [Pogona vitticeps]
MWSVRHGMPAAEALAAAAATSTPGTARAAGWWSQRPAPGGGDGSLFPLRSSCSRPLHCSAACCSRGKLLRRYLLKKMDKFWYDNPTLDFELVTKPANLANMPKSVPPRFSKEHSIRKRTLDVLLLEAVRDVLSTCEVGQEVYDLQVELSKASVGSDFSACNLYWRSTGDAEKDEHVARVLNKSAADIRCFLITHQVLRKVPFLVFIQDKEDEIIRKIEKLLAIADFGPEENEPVQSNISEQSSAMTDVYLDSSHSPVHSNLFGIDHDALNEKITEYKKMKEDKKIEGIGLSEQQQKQLAEIRKQKKMKKKKAKKTSDDDLTPQKYLMDKYSKDYWDSEIAFSDEDQLLYEEDELEAEDRPTHTK